MITQFIAHRWLCDHFGHLNVRHYAAGFDDATFAFWAQMGVGAGPIPVTLEIKTQFHHELREGDVAQIHAQVSKIGGKSVGLRFAMRCGAQVMASAEVVEVFIDPATRASCPIPAPIRAALEAF